ncbi:MAG: YggT family protein [Anaerolineales bacterium]
MFIVLANIINFIANLFIVLVIADAVLSFFLSPYHPARLIIGRIINPFLAPIRRVIPLIGMLDLSPLVLIILVEILSGVLINLLYAIH